MTTTDYKKISSGVKRLDIRKYGHRKFKTV